MSWELHRADARDLPLDDESVDLIVTSPPYQMPTRFSSLAYS